MSKTLVLAILAGVVASGCGGGVAGDGSPSAAAQPAVGPAAAAIRGEAPSVYAKAPPPVDGTLASRIWQQCPPLVLGRVDGQAIGDLKTTARVLLDDRNLYVAWQCDDRDTGSLVAKAGGRDDEVWSDDSVELFVSPDGKTFCQFVVNCKGAYLDGRGDVGGTVDKGWDSSAMVKADIRKGKGWSATLSVPLKELGVRSGKGQTWLLNLNRTKPTGEGYIEMTWSAQGKSDYGDSSGWGKLVGVSIP